MDNKNPNGNYNGSNFDHDARERKQPLLTGKTIIGSIQDNNNSPGVNARLNEMQPLIDDLKVQYGEIVRGEISFYDGSNADGVTQINQYGQDQDIWIYLDNMNKGRMYPRAHHTPLVYLLEIAAYGGTHLNGGHIEATQFSNATNINQINRVGLPLNNNTLIGTYGKLNLKTMTYTHGDKTIFESVSLPNNNMYFSAYSVSEPSKTTPITYEFKGDLENNKIPSTNAGKFLVTYFFDIETGAIVSEFVHEFENPLNPEALQSSKKLVYNFTPEMKAKVTSGKYGRYVINTDHAFTISVKNPFNPDEAKEWEVHEGTLLVDKPAVSFDPVTGNLIFNDAVGNKDITLDAIIKGEAVKQLLRHEKTGLNQHKWLLTDGNGLEIELYTAVSSQGQTYLTSHQAAVKIKSPDTEHDFEHTLENVIFGDGEHANTSYLNINNSNGVGATYDTKVKIDQIGLGSGKILEDENKDN